MWAMLHDTQSSNQEPAIALNEDDVTVELACVCSLTLFVSIVREDVHDGAVKMWGGGVADRLSADVQTAG